MAKALRLCRELVVIQGRHSAYQEASEEVMERLRNLTPLVEQISIDEAFLDVTHRRELGEIIARRLQASVWNELGLPSSLGVASNKLVAKTATNVGKASCKTGAPPNAVLTVPPGEEAAFLAPLSIRMLWGVGPKMAERLGGLGIKTIGELAIRTERGLAERFGQAGPDLQRRARGLDNRPIVTFHEAKSMSQEVTFAADIDNAGNLNQTLIDLADQVGRRLRKAHMAGMTVKLKLRWSDFTTLTRQKKLSQPTSDDNVIRRAVLNLFRRVWNHKRKVRLIGVGVSNLIPAHEQLSLFDNDQQREHILQEAIDGLKDRFGERTIGRGGGIIRTSPEN